MIISKKDFEEDTKEMTHFNPLTGAQAKIITTEKTYGMMKGDTQRILVQTPAQVAEMTPGFRASFSRTYPDGFAVAQYHEVTSSWFEDNGFVETKI
jgi:hypothetical protein